MSHPFVVVTSLNDAEIDVEIVEAVIAANQIDGVVTISSCQGNPGVIESGGGMYGHIAFTHAGYWEDLADFCFNCLRKEFAEFIDDEIRVDIFCKSEPYAWLSFRNEAIPTVTEVLKSLSKERP